MSSERSVKDLSGLYIFLNGGAGRIRTADKQFRKLLLYPSELQPRSFIVILPGLFRSACVCPLSKRPFVKGPARQNCGRAPPGVVAGGFDFGAGVIFVMRKLRKIVGQYSRRALLAVYRPIRIP